MASAQPHQLRPLAQTRSTPGPAAPIPGGLPPAKRDKQRFVTGTTPLLRSPWARQPNYWPVSAPDSEHEKGPQSIADVEPTTDSHHDVSPARNRWITLALLGLGMICFGTAPPATKIVTSEFPVFVASGLRILVGALILAPMLKLHQANPKPAMIRSRVPTLVGLAAVGLFLASILLLYGMRQVTGVVGSTIMSTNPAVAAVASMIILHEKITRQKWIGIGLAVLGVLALSLGGGSSGEDGGNQLVGTVLVLGAVGCSAGNTILGKVALARVTPIVASALATILTAMLFAPLAYWRWDAFDPRDVSLRAWIALVWWGGGTLALGSILWYTGLARVQGSTAAGFMGVSPMTALILSYVLLDERFQIVHLAGFAIVFTGVMLIAWSSMRAGAAD